MDRSSFSPYDTVAYIWEGLGLPRAALQSLELPVAEACCPSSFKVDHLAQSFIALSALAAGLFSSARCQLIMPRVTVPNEHAYVEFKSERLYLLQGEPAPSSPSSIGGLHKAADGYVRMHDGFPNHRESALRMLGLPPDATRNHVAQAILEWKAVDIEDSAFLNGCAIAALRSFAEWDQHLQSSAIADFPIEVRRLATANRPVQSAPPPKQQEKCLQGIRVIEMSRVIAAPVAGKTLAAHGADCIWITSPTLPTLPYLDIDLSRGKRTVQLNIKDSDDKVKLLELIKNADVFIQSYRPGSLAGQGFSVEELSTLNPNLIIANLNAYGSDGPWSRNRGFDSLVQTCSGINVADAERASRGEVARVLPCQALDHGAGYMLATGIMAALYKRTVGGGAYEVNVSLAGVMKYLRSLGRYEGDTAFGRKDFKKPSDVFEYLESRQTGMGELTAVRHSATIVGFGVGWDIMPKSLGSDEPKWL